MCWRIAYIAAWVLAGVVCIWTTQNGKNIGLALLLAMCAFHLQVFPGFDDPISRCCGGVVVAYLVIQAFFFGKRDQNSLNRRVKPALP